MSHWNVEFRPSADKELRKLPLEIQARLVAGLERLAFEMSHPTEPKISDLKKPGGRGDEWRLRLADYRVIFERHGDSLVILVLQVGNRRDVYKN